jgi:apolipoprotein N-acyltransferase
MSSQTLSTANPRMEHLLNLRSLPGRHPALLGLTSGIALWLAFPPAGWSWLAWVALVPLFLLIPSGRSRLAIYLGAWAGGFVFWLLALNWILCIDATASIAWAAMAFALSLLWPAFLAISRHAVRTLRLPVMLVAPIVWTAFEYLRAYILTGFPWYYLAHSQYRHLALIQVADFAGSLGVSLLIASANALIVDALTLPLFRPTPQGPRLARPIAVRVGVLAVGLASTVGYGLFRLGTARFEPGPTIALIQSNQMQRYRLDRTAPEILEEYQILIARAVKSTPRPSLIVWPETAYPYGYVAIDPKLPADEFARQVKDLSPEDTPADWTTKRDSVSAHLHEWVNAMQIPMVVGSTTYSFQPGRLDKYNSAILFEPGKSSIQSYHKLHLVPFGEYVPLLQTFPWLVALTPYRNGHIPSLTFGGTPAWFEEGKYRYATAICFEDTVPQVTRRLFAEIPDGHSPDVLLNLSNDGWFTTVDDANVVHGSSEHEMHLAVSVFRSIEHRVPLARAANTGISAVVAGNGRIVDALPSGKSDILVTTVPLDPRKGLYTTLGDWLGLLCLAITIGLVPLGWFRPAKIQTSVGTG